MAETESSCRQQLGKADQVVGGGGESEEPADADGAAMARFAQIGDGLDPAERLLDAFAQSQRDRIAGMAKRPTVNSGLAWLATLPDVAVDGDVRGDATST